MTSYTTAASATVPAIGPTVSSDGASGVTPASETRPCVTFRPTTPHNAAGTRTDPPVSVPMAAGTMPAATAAADEPAAEEAATADAAPAAESLEDAIRRHRRSVDQRILKNEIQRQQSRKRQEAMEQRYNERLEAMLKEASSRDGGTCCAIIDIDHFKKINDNLGHITGDRVLEALGSLLKQRLPPDTMVVRFGGEEFALLMPNCDQRAARRCAEDLRAEVEALYPAGIPITISIGLACSQDRPDMSLTQLLNLSDRALYAAKNQGRNRVCA